MTITSWRAGALSCVLAQLSMTGPAAAQPAPEPAPLPPPVVIQAEPHDPGRPGELAFGLGVGYAFPTSLQTPNTTSVRVRLPSGLTFEPQVVIATTSNDTAALSTRQTELTLGSLGRYPVRSHGKVDLELVASAALSSRTIDPDGDHNNTTITAISLGYGGALAYWITPHWNLSLTATNPLLAYSRNRQEQSATAESTTRSTTLGLIFDPQLAVMIHLYD